MRAELNRLRAQAKAAFEAGIGAADPGQAVRESLALSATGRPVIAGEPLEEGATLRIVAFGKAGVRMARASQDLLPVEVFAGPGVAVVNTENFRDLERFRVLAASHPIPDAAGWAAALEIEKYLQGSDVADGLLVLVSGGGSALLPAPPPEIGLEGKSETTGLLLASGASIQEINCVRKHLSFLKGGGLARLAGPARVESLILSDVIGDDFSSIASGPTAPDPTTFGEALDVLRGHGLWNSVPKSVLRRLEQGAAGEIPETPKDRDPLFARVRNRLVGSNSQSLAVVRQWLETRGFGTHLASTGLIGEAREAAATLLAAAHRVEVGDQPIAVLAGGETTVTVRGQGVGGRNQELALAFALLCETNPLSGRWVFLSGGTDGQDGPTDAAGGMVDAGTLERVRRAGLDPATALDDNNSHAALAAAGDLVVTGPTGTNVADLQVLLLSAVNFPESTDRQLVV